MTGKQILWIDVTNIISGARETTWHIDTEYPFNFKAYLHQFASIIVV